MTNRQQVTFTGSQGDLLWGQLDIPQGEIRGWALFSHCFTGSSSTKAAAHVSRSLVEEGFGVLRFDFTGLGRSKGDFSDTNFSSNIADIVAASDWLAQEFEAPSILIGHSLGGAAVLAAADQIPAAQAIATLCAPFDPEHVTRLFGDHIDTIKEKGEAEITLGGRPFVIRKQFLDDLAKQPQAERIHKLRRPLLVLHSPFDEVVSIDNANGIFQAALHPKSFVSLNKANHLITNADDAHYAANVIAAWASRYLPDNRNVKTTSQRPADNTIYVSERGTGPFTVAIEAGGHSWLADEPKDVGGDDLGPNPYQMLTAALGACTAMTLRMYARQKKWPLEHVSVQLNHEKIYAEDCTSCSTKSGQIDRIERLVTLKGEELTDEQRTRLLEIADKCPVHRTLHSEVEVVTREA